MSAVLTVGPIPKENWSDYENEEHYEIIDGIRLELSPMSAASSGLASQLSYHVNRYGIEHELGRAFSELLVHLPLPVERNRRPDVIMVPYSRWAKGRALPDTNAWDVLPDLAVEVNSPSDFVEELWQKIDEYFQAGVRLVWVISPRLQQVHVYETSRQIRVLTRDDTLDGGIVLPGFQLPLAELFPEEIAPPSV